MSTDQICAYCEHPRRYHLDGDGRCGDPSRVVGVECTCPRFVANTDTETHEVTAQVLAEADRRKSVLEVAVESERAMAGTHLPTDIIPQAPRVPTIPDERKQSRATKLSILVFDCVDQAIQAARAGRIEDAEEWRDLAKKVDEL